MGEMVEYEDLETKICSIKNDSDSFAADDRVQLSFGIVKGKYVVNIIAENGRVYRVKDCDDEATAKIYFDKYESFLEKGYAVNITGSDSAEIVPR